MPTKQARLMTDFVSQIKIVPSSQHAVFDTLSDLNHLNKIESLIPSEKIRDISYDRDTVSFRVDMPGVGEMSLRIVEREPDNTIKMVTDKSPIPFTFWVQLKEKDSVSSFLKLTLRADLPFMLKGMLSKPLQEGIDKLADGLAAWTY